MPHYLLTNENTGKVGVKKHAVTKQFFVGKLSLMFMLLFFIGGVSVVYLVNFNNVATKGYEISRLEYERDELLNKKEQNNILLSESQTLEYLRGSSRVIRMHEPKEVVYYWTTGNEIAWAN